LKNLKKRREGNFSAHGKSNVFQKPCPASHRAIRTLSRSLVHHFQVSYQLGTEGREAHSEKHRPTLVMRWREKKQTTGKNVNIQKSTG
jgi:hypothetical protein